MKTIDERKMCDTMCVLMRWSNSEVEIKQYKMPMISVRGNENKRWKRNAEKEKKQRQKKTR